MPPSVRFEVRGAARPAVAAPADMRCRFPAYRMGRDRRVPVPERAAADVTESARARSYF